MQEWCQSIKKYSDSNGDWLPNTELLQLFLEYCKYRYGITEIDQIKARTECKKIDGMSQ